MIIDFDCACGHFVEALLYSIMGVSVVDIIQERGYYKWKSERT